jgi:hypothetical protein
MVFPSFSQVNDSNKVVFGDFHYSLNPLLCIGEGGIVRAYYLVLLVP